jgi:hypothetical protein
MSTDEKTALEQVREAKEKAAAEQNKSRTGKGTRLAVGATRGRNVSIIEYEAFDTSLPDTLPSSVEEFMSLTGTNDEKVLVEYLIDGYNDAQYKAASDEIGEFINPAWPKDVQAQFRLAVRNYAKMAEVSIEEAAALMKPGTEKRFAVFQAS